MRQVLKDLYDILSEQKHTLENLLELGLEERRIIIGGESSILEDIVRQELRELSKLGAAEKKRAALLPAISAELDLKGKDITVTAIVASAQPDEREELKKLQKELTELIDRHTALNMENRELIQAHKEYSEAIMELMVDSEDPLNNFYGDDGRETPGRKKSTGFFDGHA